MTTDGWAVTPKPVDPALTDSFRAPDFEPPVDEWYKIRKRLTEKDKAALSKVFGIANMILDNE